MKHHQFLLPGLLMVCFAEFAVADAITIPNAIFSPEQALMNESNAEQQASEWGLQTDEWARYLELKQGPLGLFSPNLDPLTTLGIEARSDEERNRYAELQVAVEARRVEKLFAYQRAYDAAWQRLYPTLQRVTLTQTNSAFATPNDPKRLAIFVKENCPACEQRVKQLQAAGAPFDVYMVDSHNDDARIRAWAKRADIDPTKVLTGVITLNHGTGHWLSFGLSGDLPAAVHRVNGQWQRQPWCTFPSCLHS